MDIPQIIAGRFRIEREIGKGGMGTVYRASHLGLARRVAVKVLKKDIASNPEVAERFMREARTMARLRHPGAAMIFDAGRLADGRPFIVMEYVEGETLAETLAREGTLTPEYAVRIASEICDVLAEAHNLGIVHRDLKPSNIMLNGRGVCVLDFGIAKVLATTADATKTHATTESGLVIGTPRYMSPEQCMGQPVGPASDLYSVGVLLYEMLAGRPPFVDQLASAVLVKQATAIPPALLALRPDAPRALVMATHTLLAKNPLHRPKKATDARLLLTRSIAPPPALTEDKQSGTPPFASTIDALNNRGSAVFRVAMIFAAILMLGAFFAWSRHQPSAALPIETTALAATGVASSPTSNPAPFAAPNASSSPLIARAAAVRGTPATTATPAVPPKNIIPPKSLSNEAQRTAASVLQVPVSDARFVQAKSGPVIVAIHELPKNKGADLYIIEGRGGSKNYEMTARGKLDVSGFRAAKWMMEVVDLDRDGYDEVLCTGESPRGKGQVSRRLVVYVPRVRETFSLHVMPDCCEANSIRAMWSSNTMTRLAQPFRRALRERAFPSTHFEYFPDAADNARDFKQTWSMTVPSGAKERRP